MDSIEVKNLTPKFLEFYSEAIDENADSDRRWELWNKYYGFAAVPPGDQGKELARKLLEGAWLQYKNVMTDLKNWEPDNTHIKTLLSEIKSLLHYQQSIDLVVIYFVGGFEGNGFVTVSDKKKLVLCLPVEGISSDVLLAHELTHIVHAKKANLSGEWERSIASVIMQEGLAMHVSEIMVPGMRNEDYVEHYAGWLDECYVNRERILKGIQPYLNKSDSDTVMKFTMGTGTSGIQREAYFVGWELVKYLLNKGHTISELASVVEQDIPNYIEDALCEFLGWGKTWSES
jgi:hypothetical protein